MSRAYLHVWQSFLKVGNPRVSNYVESHIRVSLVAGDEIDDRCGTHVAIGKRAYRLTRLACIRVLGHSIELNRQIQQLVQMRSNLRALFGPFNQRFVGLFLDPGVHSRPRLGLDFLSQRGHVIRRDQQTNPRIRLRPCDGYSEHQHGETGTHSEVAALCFHLRLASFTSLSNSTRVSIPRYAYNWGPGRSAAWHCTARPMSP